MVSDLLFLWPWCFSYIHVSKDHSVSHSEKQSWQSGFKYCKVNKEQTKYTLKKSPPKISPQLLVHRCDILPLLCLARCLSPPTQTSLTEASWQTCGFWGQWTLRLCARKEAALLSQSEKGRGASGWRRGLDVKRRSLAPRSLVSTGAPCCCPGTAEWGPGQGNALGKPLMTAENLQKLHHTV